MQFDPILNFKLKSKEFAPNSVLNWIWFELNLKVTEKGYYSFGPLAAHRDSGSQG
jgi:hypothetical protein